METWQLLTIQILEASLHESEAVDIYVFPVHLIDVQEITQDFPKTKIRQSPTSFRITILYQNFPEEYERFMKYINKKNWQPFAASNNTYYFKRTGKG